MLLNQPGKLAGRVVERDSQDLIQISNPNGSLFAYKNPLFFSCFIGCISVPLIRSASHDFSIVGYSPEDLEAHDKHIELFENWLSNFEKAYETVEEKLRRFEVFKDNLKHIDETNKKVKSYWLGLNEFTDLSHKEFKNKERERERKKRKGESSPELVAGATVCRDHVELVTTVRCSLESPETAMQPSSCSSRQDEAVDTKEHRPPPQLRRRRRPTFRFGVHLSSWSSYIPLIFIAKVRATPLNPELV
uniref:Cathepsin propeptide inhibitor domain-containing protein n=1 Tax=Brassica oleracea var. oleracea TaxID=109376 RepID=A0A0D3CBW1_BRAOL